MSEILKIKQKYEDSLRKIEGVLGVGAKTNGGFILVYVPKVTPQIASELPNSLNGIPIQIIQTGGKFIPLSFKQVPPAAAIYAERTSRIRPALGGISLGHPQVSAGTLGCAAVDPLINELYGLSNNHVIALDWGTEHVGVKGDSTLQPGPYDGGVDPMDKIGELDRWIPVQEAENNLVDIAAFKPLPNNLSDAIEEIGKPSESIDPVVGMRIVKSGRTSGITYGEIIDVNATITVSGWGEVTFVDQITMTKMLDPGDSGSWIGHLDTYRTVGIGHAGSPDISVACKAKRVEELMGLQIIPPAIIPFLGSNPYLIGGVWASAFMVGQALFRSPSGSI